ncbi:MAG: helix-turn-helix transcriptional regulator [Oscillospiraceae bacterium]|nr:helix-turn-helix transcriptional regulator [Oscillospiraceae bacterium]
MGRILDSAIVLLSGVAKLSELPVIAVQALDVAALAAVIVLMAVNGDFHFAAAAEKTAPASQIPALTKEDEAERIRRLSELYGLTPKETEALNVVLHSDLPTGRLGEELGISSRTLYRHLNSIYDKTDTDSRMALVLKFR